MNIYKLYQPTLENTSIEIMIRECIPNILELLFRIWIKEVILYIAITSL